MHSNSPIFITEPAFQISAISTHTLVLGEEETEVILPCRLDSRLVRSVQFSFSGTVDHSTPVSPKDLLSSSVVRLFRRSLSLNAELLGIIDISEVVLDDHFSSTLGIPKVFVTPACCACLGASPQPHVLSIHLAYNWKSSGSSGLSIFSHQTLVSLDPALDKLTRKLFSAYIVGSYPWLFGPLRTKLHLEHKWFPSLVRSLLAITDRSGSQTFRDKVQSLEITIRISLSNNTTATTYSRLSSGSTSRGRLSDSSATGTSDTLILALELVLKNAARSPPFKDACLRIPTLSSSNDETLDLNHDHPSEEFSGNSPRWVDLLSTDPGLSGDLWVHQFDDNISSGDSQETAAGNGEPNSTSQLATSKFAGRIFSDIPLAGPLNWDLCIDKEDEFTSYDVSPPPMGDSWTGMSVLTCQAPHENFIALDDDLDVLSDPCIFDDADEDDVMLFAFE